MKINSINLYSSNRTQLGYLQGKKLPTASFDAPLARPSLGYMSYPINFTSIKHPIPKEFFALEELLELPCVYCSKKMVPRNVFDSLDWLNEPQTISVGAFVDTLKAMKGSLSDYERKIMNQIIIKSQKQSMSSKTSLPELLKSIDYRPSKNIEKVIYKTLTPNEYNNEVVQVVKKYEDCLFPVEKTVFKEMQSTAKEIPNANLQQSLLALRPKHFETLVNEQNKICDELVEMTGKLPEKPKEKLTGLFKEMRALIVDDSSDNPFKRKYFIQSVNQILEDSPQNDSSAAIKEKILELPSSTNSVSAFIVKYSGKIPVKTKKGIEYKYRSFREIGQSLLRRSVSSIEHIKPQNDWDCSEKGRHNIENLVLAHNDCNRERAHTKLTEQITNHPEIIEAPQKQIDFIVKKINNGELVGLNSYPAGIKKSFFNESNGLIRLDISKLDIKPE